MLAVLYGQIHDYLGYSKTGDRTESILVKFPFFFSTHNRTVFVSFDGPCFFLLRFRINLGFGGALSVNLRTLSDHFMHSRVRISVLIAPFHNAYSSPFTASFVDLSSSSRTPTRVLIVNRWGALYLRCAYHRVLLLTPFWEIYSITVGWGVVSALSF